MERRFYVFEPIEGKEVEKLKKKVPEDIKEFYELINKSNKINEVLNINKTTLDKVYAQALVDLQKIFVVASRLEAGYMLLRDVLKIPIEECNVETLIRAIVVTDCLLLAYRHLWLREYPKKIPPFLPLVANEIAEENNMDVF